MVWSTRLESAIMTVECGGGHRSWDFYLSKDGTATFAAIKKKDVIFCTENLQHVLNKSILKVSSIFKTCQNYSSLFFINIYSSKTFSEIYVLYQYIKLLLLIYFYNKFFSISLCISKNKLSLNKIKFIFIFINYFDCPQTSITYFFI